MINWSLANLTSTESYNTGSHWLAHQERNMICQMKNLQVIHTDTCRYTDRQMYTGTQVCTERHRHMQMHRHTDTCLHAQIHTRVTEILYFVESFCIWLLYWLQTFTKGLDPKDRLAREQKLLRKRLGLDMVPGLDVGMDQLFNDSDLLLCVPEKKVITKQKSFEVWYASKYETIKKNWFW